MSSKKTKASGRSEWQELSPRDWDKKRLLQQLERWGGKKVLVVGDVGVDRYTEGRVERISPEAPVPIVQVTSEKHKLGLAANVADNVQAVGAIPILVGLVGGDPGAEVFRKLLREVGISDRNLVVDSDRRTILKERVVSERQQLLRIDYEDLRPMNPGTGKKILQEVEKALPAAQVVVLEDYAKGLLTPGIARDLIEVCRSAKKPLYADPNPRTPLDFYRGVSLLTPNTKEAEALCGMKILDEASLLKAGRHILEETEAETLIITRGKDGMAIFERDQNQVLSIPTYAREVYDVSGAGDTVIAVLAVAAAAGASLVDAVVLANLAAGVEVGKRGTATVTPDEIRAAMGFFEALTVR
jgi:rfaE bifunctional protein kinase chain/domain